MKKFIVILLTVLTLCGCSKSSKGTFTEITLADLLDKFENKETFAVLLTREACEVCENAQPIYEEVVDDLGKDAYHVYFTVKWLFGMEGTSSDSFYELLGYISEDIPEYAEGFDVPIALYVKDGHIVYHFMGFDFEDIENISKQEKDYLYNVYAKGFMLLKEEDGTK